jgi:hypothetical protein
VVAAIDIENLPGDQPGGIVGEKGASRSDIIDADQLDTSKNADLRR